MTVFKTSIAILLSVSVLTGCPSSNDENTSDKKKLNVSSAVEEDTVTSNTGINEMGRPYIVTLNASGDKSNEYVSGGYFLAPLIKYSTVGLISTAQESSINDDGTNYLALSNIFETSLKTMQLDLYYSSEDSRDKFNKLFGLWRTSFTSYVDFKVDYDNANIKSRTYDTPRNACESGFEDIKSDVYRALLQDAHTVYDESISLCVIRNDNKDVGSFNVWNNETGIVGDFHYLTLPSGETIVFRKDGEQYIGDDRGLVVSMRLLEDDSFEYIDAQSVVNTYSKEGKLIKIMLEGQETIIHYDDQFKITHITGPLDSSLIFNYSEDQLLQSITFSGKEARFIYNEDNFLVDISVATDDVIFDDEEDANTPTETLDEATDLAQSDVEKDASIGEAGVAAQAIENVYNLATFTYNDQELLASINRIAVADAKNQKHSISASTTYYIYDDLKRVINIEENSESGFQVTYQANSVEKTFNNGNKITHNLSFVGSKQQVKVIDDNADLLENRFNKLGQLTQVELAEEPETDEQGNIITQGLENGKKRLKMNFSYNTRGLINKIQYASVSSGKRFVQLDYKSRYPKPTKVLTNDAVTFFDINQKGQIIRKTAVKFTKEMKLRAASITFNEVLTFDSRIDKIYSYDAQGFLNKVTNEVTSASKSYQVSNSGIVSKKIKIKSLGAMGGWQEWSEWQLTGENKGWTTATGYVDITKPHVQTIFVGGAGDKSGDLSGDSYVYEYSYYSKNHDDYDNYSTWLQLDMFAKKFLTTLFDPFEKSRAKLVVIGHSWGGDSAVESSKLTRYGKGVDLLITVDPVGVFDRDDGAKYWIQLYAQAGRPTGGYMTLRTGYKTILSFKYYRCKRHGWHFHCGWRTKTIRIPYPKMTWIKTMAWNQSDWIAFAGGKGSYGSYDPGESRPNQFIRIPAHHGDFDYMLWNMEHGKNHKTNNEFNINKNRDYSPNIKIFKDLEIKYGDKVADYGNTFWK